jgi:two-component system response regulator
MYAIMLREKFLIVLADDDLDDQEFLREAFKECKVKVETSAVYNGLQLLDFLHKRGVYKNIAGTPDLVMVDLQMPFMNGFEVIREIKNDKDLKNIPIYVMSTSNFIEDKDKVLKLGANGFYTKGQHFDDLLRIVKEICEECFESITHQKK